MTPESVSTALQESASIKAQMAREQAGAIAAVIEAITNSLASGGTVFFFGNGGSAADSQHLAAEMVGRFTLERRALPAIALTTDTSALTSIGNDYGFDRIFIRQLQGLGQDGDVAVGLSTSGNSPNVLLALDAARERGMVTVAMTGAIGGRMVDRVDFCLCVPSAVTARIQESHITVGHLICQGIDEAFAAGRIPVERGRGPARQ